MRKSISLEILAAGSDFHESERKLEEALSARPRGLRGRVYDDRLVALQGEVLKRKLRYWGTILACMRERPDFMPPTLNALLNVQKLVVMQQGPLARSLERRFLALLGRKRFSAEADRLLQSLRNDTAFQEQLVSRRHQKARLKKIIAEARLTATKIMIYFRKNGKFYPTHVLNYLRSIDEILETQDMLARAYMKIFYIMGKRSESLGLGKDFRNRLYKIQRDIVLIRESVISEREFWRNQYHLEEEEIVKKTRKKPR